MRRRIQNQRNKHFLVKLIPKSFVLFVPKNVSVPKRGFGNEINIFGDRIINKFRSEIVHKFGNKIIIGFSKALIVLVPKPPFGNTI